MERGRGQVSTEYLIVVAFITFLVISTLGLSIFYSGQVQDRVKLNQLQNFANKVISSSESVFFSGEPSKATINAYLPAGVESIQVLSDEIVFNIYTSSGLTIISYSSYVPISGSITNTEGVKKIILTADSEKINIAEGS